jgi:MYXO-CTERM domain-containing protein
MSSGPWSDRPEDAPEPQEAQAPPERSQPVFSEVPGEAPTADLGASAKQEPPPPEPVVSKQEPVVSKEPEPMPASAPTPQEAPLNEPEPMPVSAPTAQEAPLPGPDAETVAADGHGPGPEALPATGQAGPSPWERPEVVVGAAFAAGIVLAALLRRRRA